MRKKKKEPSKKKILHYCPNIDDCPDKSCESCDTIYYNYFVKHPPKESLTPEELKKTSPFIGEHEMLTEKLMVKSENGIKLPVSFFIATSSQKFKETKNPVYAIEAFLLSHEAGLYPPISILTYLADTFKKYHETAGKGRKTSLDKLFGFSKQKGQDNAFKQVIVTYERDEKLMLDLYRLRRLFDLPVEKAAEMVRARLEITPDKEWNKTGFKLIKPSYSRLRDIYFQKWIKIFEQDDHDEITARGFSRWTETDKIEYLKKYPPASIPEKLRQKYKIKV